MMQKKKIVSKLVYAFMFMALLLFIGGFVGYFGISHICGNLTAFTKGHLPSIHSLNTISESQQTIAAIEQVMVMSDFDIYGEEKKALLTDLAKAWTRADNGWTLYESLPQTREKAAILDNLKPAWATWQRSHSEIVRLFNEGKKKEAATIAAGPGKEAFNATEQLMKNLSDLNLQQIEKAKNNGSAKALWLKIIAIGGTIVGMMIAIALGIFFAAVIAQQIKSFSVKLKEASNEFASASGQIETTSQQLASGTSDQAAVVEETYAVIEELTVSNHQHDSKIRQLKDLVDEAEVIREETMKHVNDSVKAMESIKKFSEDTSSIVKNIESIAFQTNLLALNASVEAARAGEVGAGFAVVADEVRNLAIRASQAAENTNKLIDETVQAVYQGVELVNNSLIKFQEYGEHARFFVDFMGQAREASHEEAQGFEKINQSMNQINKVVQENAACAEETAAAAEEMNAQSEAIRQSVTLLAAIIDKKYTDSSLSVDYSRELHNKPLLPSRENHHLSLIPMKNEEVES